MAWDDNKQEWMPAWGYKRANDASELPYLEVPDNAGDEKGCVLQVKMGIMRYSG